MTQLVMLLGIGPVHLARFLRAYELLAILFVKKVALSAPLAIIRMRLIYREKIFRAEGFSAPIQRNSRRVVAAGIVADEIWPACGAEIRALSAVMEVG